MKLRIERHGRMLDLTEAEPLGKGGEAAVFAVPGTAWAAKVYHDHDAARAAKLRAMLANPPEDPTASQGHVSIAWPQDLLIDVRGQVAGYVMPMVRGMGLIADYYFPKVRRAKYPLFTYHYLVATAQNLATAVRALHRRGYVMGDVNEGNILVAPTAMLTLVDTDSFQVREPGGGRVHRCRVGTLLYTPRELQEVDFAKVERGEEHDLFGLGVLLFQLLMESTHPFQARYAGPGDPPEPQMVIAAGGFPHGTGSALWQPPRHAPAFGMLDPRLRGLFTRCFVNGHRDPKERPPADEWRAALVDAAAALVPCPRNASHFHWPHAKPCPWCERAVKLGGRDPFPALAQVRTGTHLKPLTKGPPPAKRPQPQVRPRWQPAPQMRLRQQSARQPRPAPAPAPVPQPQPQPRTATGWTLKRWAALAAAVVALIGGWSWLGLGKWKPKSQPTAAEAAANVAAAAALGSGSVGTRQVFALGGGHRFAVRYVPAGTFTMGGSDSYETPPSVTLSSPFWMGETEVTQGQWQALMGNNPSHFKGDPNLPVEQVSWNDAQNYVKALNAWAPLSNGWCWTLPTEAQWEYACRGGTTGQYAGDLEAMAWYSNNSDSKTHPVGTKKANAWGLFDMHGNVWEWCADWYGDYPKGAANDPTGPNNGSDRVNRGGSWSFDDRYCRSAYRDRFTPVGRISNCGFRVAAVPGARGLAGAGATVPTGGAGARDERPAPAPVVPVLDVSGAKAGERREAELGDGVKLELCGIPAGTFTIGGMGSDETQHEVTPTKAFWLGRTEVTQAQWAAVKGENPSRFKGKDLPVETVSWNDAAEFCKKLNAKGLLSAGWRWALPTEAQWEYACRAGTTGEYAGTLADMAWYGDNSGSKTHPVGTKQANAWGLCDMHGNVWEWCADWYGDGPKGAATDPTGSNSGSSRVYRGGSWNRDGTLCRSAARGRCASGYRNLNIGFRVAAVPGGS